MILHVHTTNNIWFILGNSLIQEGKHMDGKLEGDCDIILDQKEESDNS